MTRLPRGKGVKLGVSVDRLKRLFSRLHAWLRKIEFFKDFEKDVVFQHRSVAPGSAWLITFLVGSIIGLTYIYSPGAADRACRLTCVGDQGTIPLAAAYWTIAGVSVFALIIGWQHIVTRWWRNGGMARRRLIFTGVTVLVMAALFILNFGFAEGLLEAQTGLSSWQVLAIPPALALTVYLYRLDRRTVDLANRLFGRDRGRLSLDRGDRERPLWQRALDSAYALASVVVIRAALFVWRAPSVIISFIDFLLARPLAILAGTKRTFPPFRYLVLLFWMALGIVAGFADEANPIFRHMSELAEWNAPWGLVGVIWAMVIVVSVVRRWSWIERDRDAFLIARKAKYDSKERVWRVGYSEDLRDEALTALIFMFVLIPLALRQIDQHYNAFTIATQMEMPAARWQQLAVWMGFFGAELAKSIPFVDWSEVFYVENGSPIEPATALGAQIVFFLRATLDLLLLAAILQAVQIAARTRDQNTAFDAGNLPILDPFGERPRFRALWSQVFDPRYTRADEQIAVSRFADKHKYDPERLCEISVGATKRAQANSPIERDTDARCAALAVFARQTKINPTIGLIQDRMSGNEDFGVGEFAVRLAHQMSPARSLQMITALGRQREASPLMRSLAIRELGRLRHRDRADSLAIVLTDSTEPLVVRIQAALALAKLGDMRCRAPLQDMVAQLAPPSRWRRFVSWVRRSELADKYDPLNTLSAAYALGLVSADRSVEEIAALFRQSVRSLAIRAIRTGQPRLTAPERLDVMTRLPPDGRPVPDSFKMGSPDDEGDPNFDDEAFFDEKPQKEVKIDRPFELGTFQVTYEEYASFCDATGRGKPFDRFGRGRKPVTAISWYNANDYCTWLSRWTGENYRLPTEVEWEYACRAGTDTRYPWGVDWDDSKAVGNSEFDDGPVDVDDRAYPPNDWGFFHMIGNVWEWCADPVHLGSNEGRPPNSSGIWLDKDADTDSRILRGGARNSVPKVLRSADRVSGRPVLLGSNIGFRVARDLD